MEGRLDLREVLTMAISSTSQALLFPGTIDSGYDAWLPPRHKKNAFCCSILIHSQNPPFAGRLRVRGPLLAESAPIFLETVFARRISANSS